MSLKAAAVLNPGAGKGHIWRGVIDDVEYKSNIFGRYQSGTRIWRCFHRHRTDAAAQSCAERELRGKRMARSEETR